MKYVLLNNRLQFERIRLLLLQCLQMQKAKLQGDNSVVVISISHIQGVLVKTIKLMEDGIKPVFVFEGKPPEMKQGEVVFCLSIATVA